MAWVINRADFRKGSTPSLSELSQGAFGVRSGGGRGGGIDHPRIFMVFTKETASKYVKLMKLSLRWYLTDYTESLYTCYYILVNIWRKYQLIWLTVCQSMEANKWLCFQTFRVFQFSEFFRVFLILINNPSFHLGKPSKQSLDTTVSLSWMSLKICDCDKLLSSFSQLWEMKWWIIKDN